MANPVDPRAPVNTAARRNEGRPPHRLQALFYENYYIGNDPVRHFGVQPFRYTYEASSCLCAVITAIFETIMAIFNFLFVNWWNKDAYTSTSSYTIEHVNNYRKVFNQTNPHGVHVLACNSSIHHKFNANQCQFPNSYFNTNKAAESEIGDILKENTQGKKILVAPVNFNNSTWGAIHVDRIHRKIYFLKAAHLYQHMDGKLDYYALVREEMEGFKQAMKYYYREEYQIVEPLLAQGASRHATSPSLVTTPEQNNGYDCAVYVFHYAALAGERQQRDLQAGCFESPSLDRLHAEIKALRQHMNSCLRKMTPDQLRV